MTEIFVFGSNLAGRHGAGAALEARKKHGAVYGKAIGRQGNSYAIPTKDTTLFTLPIEKIAPYVKTFLRYANDNPQDTFLLTAIGCGLAGYKPEQIAPLFTGASENVILPPEFKEVLDGEE